MYCMSERPVAIYVSRITRDRIIKKKDGMTYDEYFNEMMGAKK